MGWPTPPGLRPGMGPRPPCPGGGGIGLPVSDVGGRRAPGGGGMGFPLSDVGGRGAAEGGGAGRLPRPGPLATWPEGPEAAAV